MWQPIKTAPKDGTEILVACANDHAGTMLGRFVALEEFASEAEIDAELKAGAKDSDLCEPDWFVADFCAGYRLDLRPTHWMPLPEPPTRRPQNSRRERSRSMKADTLPVVGTVWRHKESGGVYAIIGVCRLEATNAPAYLYTSASSGVIWARDMDEFLDGRFENITPTENRVSHIRDANPADTTPE